MKTDLKHIDMTDLHDELVAESDFSTIEIQERIDFLKNIRLFFSLSERQMLKVARVSKEATYNKGEYICHQGEMGSALYIIYSGEVEVVRESDAGEQVIYMAQPGEVIGEMAILADIQRTASLRANGEVRLLEINGTEFVELLLGNPDMSIQVIRMLVKRLTFSSYPGESEKSPAHVT